MEAAVGRFFVFVFGCFQMSSVLRWVLLVHGFAWYEQIFLLDALKKMRDDFAWVMVHFSIDKLF